MEGCWIMCTNLHGKNDDFPKKECFIFTLLRIIRKEMRMAQHIEMITFLVLLFLSKCFIETDKCLNRNWTVAKNQA